MKATRIAAVCLTVLAAVAVPAHAQTDASCDQVQYRHINETGQDVELWACPSPRPGEVWYHASLSSTSPMRHSDSITVWYYPYYDHDAEIEGSKRTVGLNTTYYIETPSFYAAPQEIQACAETWAGFFCAWY
ncbi:MAG TPA: hypothetical protein VF821_15665 [Lentzea sp.]